MTLSLNKAEREFVKTLESGCKQFPLQGLIDSLGLFPEAFVCLRD